VRGADYLDKTPVTIKPNQQDSQEELKKKEAKLLGQENAQKFTLRHKGWIYEIADWKGKYLTMKQSALLEEAGEAGGDEDRGAGPGRCRDPGGDSDARAEPAERGPAAGESGCTEDRSESVASRRSGRCRAQRDPAEVNDCRTVAVAWLVCHDAVRRSRSMGVLPVILMGKMPMHVKKTSRTAVGRLASSTGEIF
jgi:hypothetical protein